MHSMISSVYEPENPDYPIMQKQMKYGGGLVSFGIKENKQR
ncbi:hypothetical protein [Paranoxybacillus vitaminiphilus]|nr:hypothetical protein [Anoxybacillus vitaminiphilus]